jgi:peptide/nickel transport system permease protein
MGLRGYVARRIVYSLVLIWAVITINFLIFSMLPGDPMAQYVSSLRGRIDKERYQQLRHDFGLDIPLHERYFHSIINMLTFNFGRDAASGDPVWTAMQTPMLNTILLMATAEVTSIIVGILLGVIAAHKRDRPSDTLLTTGSLVTYSVPIFFVGWILILIFAVQLHWFPSGGWIPIEWGRNPPANFIEYVMGRLFYIVLPAFTLFLFTAGGWILLARACVLETINEDYVVTARAKGLKERTVLYKHVLKNASLPLITNVALAFASLIAGAIITETLFSYNGMGLLTWHAIFPVPNLPLLQAIFYITALLVIIANFTADLLYGVIDPRIKYG